jgi:hypothetical protein
VEPRFGLDRELVGRALSGPGIALGAVARGDPLGQGDCLGVIALGSKAKHGHCEEDDSQPSGWDQDE